MNMKKKGKRKTRKNFLPIDPCGRPILCWVTTLHIILMVMHHGSQNCMSRLARNFSKEATMNINMHGTSGAAFARGRKNI